MKDFIKKNFAVLLAFALPILLILVVALTTYLPSLFISTNYDFIYISCNDSSSSYYSYNCNGYVQKRLYSVVDDKFVVNEKYTARIFLHDTKKNENKEISLLDVQKLKLSGLLTSPDGVTVSSGYSPTGGCGEFFIFGGCGGSSSYGYYLAKGRSRSKLNLINNSDSYYYNNNFQFLGWVIEK